MAWITSIESSRRDERGRLVKRYRVGWHEIARDADGQPIPRYPKRPDSPPKLLRRQETTTPARQHRTGLTRSTRESHVGNPRPRSATPVTGR